MIPLKPHPVAVRRLDASLSPMRSPMRASCSPDWNSTTATSISIPISRCVCRRRSSTGCASRDPERSAAAPGAAVARRTRIDAGLRHRSARRSRRDARTGCDSEVPRPRVVDRGARVRGALPLLLSAHVPVRGPSAGRVAFPSLAAVERDPTITEVILSGGDPLMLKDAPLARLVRRLDAIPPFAPHAYPHALAGRDPAAGDQRSCRTATRGCAAARRSCCT